MGDFNPNAPNPLGVETRYQRSSVFQADSPLKAVAMRFRPGAVTISEFHSFFRLVRGTPGLAIEIVDDLDPTVQRTKFFPGTDTNKVTTGLEDFSNGAANFGEVDAEYTLTDGHRNATNLATNQWLYDMFSANDAGALSGARILAVRNGTQVRPSGASGNSRAIPVQGVLRIDSTIYTGRRGTLDNAKPRWYHLRDWAIGEYFMNPSTNLPWTDAQVDDLLDASDPDLFGIRFGGTVLAEQFAIAALWVDVEHVAVDNRFGRYYSRDAPEQYWAERTLAATAALSANTWYYVIAWALNGTQGDYFHVPILEGGDAAEAVSASASGEHRRVYDVLLHGRTGVARQVTARPGAVIPGLFDASGTINSQSVPYTAAQRGVVQQVPPGDGGGNHGQQFTTPGSGLPSAYSAMVGPVGWADLRRRPDAPLIVELRTTGTIGGGSLLATATLDPGTVDSGEVVDQQVQFDAAVALSTATQYHLLFRSDASDGRAWQIVRFPMNDDAVYLVGTTGAEIEGTSFGGATDNYDRVGSPALDPPDHMDAPYAILAAPDPPPSQTIVVVPAQSEDDPNRPAGVTNILQPTILPPRVMVVWAPTGHTTDFESYRVYRRSRELPVRSWTLIGVVDVPDGYSAADVEAQHTTFSDYEAGWAVAGAAWSDGWEYVVTVRLVNGNESLLAVQSNPSSVTVDGTYDSWLTSNASPWLNTPIRTETGRSSRPADEISVGRPLGRDNAVAAVPAGIPLNRYRLRWRQLGHVSEERTRQAWAAALGGRQMALLDCRGDRALGVLTPPAIGHSDQADLEAEAELIVTGNDSAVAGFNEPAGIVFDGSTEYVSHADDVDLRPGTGDFSTVVVWSRDGTPPSSEFLVAKNDAASNGWEQFVNNSGNLVSRLGTLQLSAPAELSAPLTVTITSWDRDGDGVLYVEGVEADRVAASSESGRNLNGTDVVYVGRRSSGNHFDGHVYAWAYYPRALSPAEALKLTKYFFAAFADAPTVPPGANLFCDLRDDRCWDGINSQLTDLSGLNHIGTVVNAPPTVGVPWPLGQLTRRRA